jgi:L-aminopeptidase/D-esterase-like protein
MSITDVPGIRVGHATDADARTGCTVVLGPFRAASDVRGAGTGTRELLAASPRHLVGRVDAILLTGGAAFGLAAADGVVAWLEEQGRGYDTRVARVPIVPAAVVFDLAVGVASRRPDAPMGRAACEAAHASRHHAPVSEGSVGAGTGTLVGMRGTPGGNDPGGVGTASVEGSGFTVGALVVVNALGDVLDDRGRFLAGARDAHGEPVSSARLAREVEGGPGPFGAPPPGTNTTLCVVATDAPVDRVTLEAVARAGSAGMARRIAPSHTPFDGDVVFAVSTAEATEPASPERTLALSALATAAVEEAIERAVRAAGSTDPDGEAV